MTFVLQFFDKLFGFVVPGKLGLYVLLGSFEFFSISGGKRLLVNMD